eukprot:jgi/Botrbrau1/16836/Bobra.150_2s0060.1
MPNLGSGRQMKDRPYVRTVFTTRSGYSGRTRMSRTVRSDIGTHAASDSTHMSCWLSALGCSRTSPSGQVWEVCREGAVVGGGKGGTLSARSVVPRTSKVLQSCWRISSCCNNYCIIHSSTILQRVYNLSNGRHFLTCSNINTDNIFSLLV